MKRYKAAQTLNFEPLPIVSLDWVSGMHIVAEFEAMSASQGHVETNPLTAGAYMITANAPIMLRGDGQPAGPAPGSIYIASGMPIHLMLPGGPISVFATEASADVYIVPLS